MAILPLVIAPDPRLSICSEPVNEVTDETRRLMDDMVETMHHEEGIGLAAVQVGVHKRILVMQLPEEEQPYFVINPEIIEASDEKNMYDEGCLSFPGQQATVVRPKEVRVRYLDYWGKEQEIKGDGLLATCIQHEMDHLNGVVFIDHVSSLKRQLIMKKVTKLKKLSDR